ncbi:MAG: adenine deaminase [Longimicrobiales bacterium]
MTSGTDANRTSGDPAPVGPTPVNPDSGRGAGSGRNDTLRLLAVARCDEPADVVFRGGRLVNVLSGEIEDEVQVAVAGTRIAGVGRSYDGRETVDLDRAFLLPGLIDAHVHIESSLVTPREFARAVVPRGTTTVVTDPHEIANVHGMDGIRYMLADSEGLPLSVFVMASSCVPATPLGTAGAELGVDDLAELARHPRVLGLAELMNFPGVIHGDEKVLGKLETFAGRVVDGHAPGVTGPALSAYVAAGPGSDHECTTAEEALEKIRRGMWVFFREATNARNLQDLLPALTPANRRRVALCTDDRQPPDLLDKGGIDAMVRTVVARGLDPVEAVRLATLNPAEYFGLRERGAVAPGRRADLLVVEELDAMEVSRVWVGGEEVARRGRVLGCDGETTGQDGLGGRWNLPTAPEPPAPSMRVRWDSVDFGISARDGPFAEDPLQEEEGRGGRVRVIEVVPNQLVTGSGQVEPTVRDGAVVADPERDLLKIAVLERHTGSGRVGLGLVRGVGLREGALAGTVAHDHHNLITVGADDDSMTAACRAVAEVGGGLAVARGGEILARVELPVGGLMSRKPVEEVRRRLDELTAAARSLGSSLHDPFMAMSFLGLEVIPSLKITDRGLVDVDAFEGVGLWV